MPIKQIRNDSITQKCAKCGADRDINYSELELGVNIDPDAGIKDSNIIALPPCDECGAKEFLVRNWDNSGDGETSGRLMHRKAVNRLAQNLKELGRINSACHEEIRADKREPPDVLEMESGEKSLNVYIDHV